MTATILDLKGLKCPLPALKARKALKSVPAGAELTVLCTDPMAGHRHPQPYPRNRDALVARESTDGVLSFTIRRAG